MSLIRALVSLSLAFTAATALSAADITDIEVDVTMERTVFATGEEIVFSVHRCNPTDETITQRFGCPCCHDEMLMLDAEGQEVANCSGGCISAVTSETWLPGQCNTRTYRWAQLEPYCDLGTQVPSGAYQARHLFAFNSFDVEVTTFSDTFVIGEAPVAIPALSHLGAGALAFLLALFATVKLRAPAR
ncbi:MAG: hypothetical protein AAGF23_13500 [Acidobacteriota bacterium]